MRKVIVPIHIKLMSFFIIILTSAIAYYVYYAINLFESDKSAYVFEAVRSQNASYKKLVDERLKNIQRVLNLLSEKNVTPRVVKSIFDQNEWLFAYGSFRNNSFNKFIFDRKMMDSKKQVALDFKSRPPLDILKSNNRLGSYRSGEIESSFIFHKKNGLTHILLFEKKYITSIFKQSKLYDFLLMNSESGDSFFTGLQSYKHVDRLLEESKKIKAQNGTIVIKDGYNNWISDIKKLESVGLSLITLVNEDKAFEAAKFLKHKSFYVGSLIIALTIFLVIFFSKIFTGPIEKLFQASRNFAQRNFDFRVSLNNRDELGVLADSFNSMADEIVVYMSEMKEKERLENELKTAQLVQKSFFPIKEINDASFNLKAFYSPASECGGDWWGIFQKNHYKIVILIDATGHGTPAALITAVIHNSITALEYLSKKDDSFITDSSQIMDYLNQSICNVGSEILATAFVAVFDMKDKSLNYTNASHNPPLLFPAKENIEKSDLKPLMENNGKRLGEDAEERYSSTKFSWDGKTNIAIYTDGLTEGANPEGKQFSNRRFTKSLVANANKEISSIVDELINEAFEFYNEKEQDDDITVVGISIS